MAAKSKAKPSLLKNAKLPKLVKAKARKLNYTPAQYKAYVKASRGAIAKAQFRNQVQRYQQRRLQGAAKASRKVAVKNQQAVRARVKTYAVSQTYRQTRLGYQSRNLQIQAARRLFQAQSIATQKQFAYLGERIHAQTTALQTVTTRQAQDFVRKSRSAARKARASKNTANLKRGRPSRPGKPVNRTRVSNPQKIAKSSARAAGVRKRTTSPYAGVGRAAGAAAAARVPSSAKLPAASPKKSAVKPKKRKAATMNKAATTRWITAGNDQGTENCAVVALANHLLLTTGCRVSDEQVHEVQERCDDRIPSALFWALLVWNNFDVQYKRIYGPVRGCAVIGALNHAAVLVPGNLMVSWGEIVPLENGIEEAWRVEWRPSSKSGPR